MAETQRPAVVSGPGEGIYLSFNGARSRIVATGEQTDGALMVSIGQIAPGGGARPHSHSFDEGFWISDTEIDFTAGNETVSIGEGGFVNIRGGTAHFPDNRSGRPGELITICAPAGFDEFQIAVSEAVAGPEGPFPKADDSVREKMVRVAPEFGIDLEPDEAAFEKDPDVTVKQPGKGNVIGVVGDVYRFLARGADTGGRYAIWHATVYPGGGPPPHRHEREEEFFYVLSGEVMIYDDGKQVRANAGTAAVLPKGNRHWFKNESDEPATMLVIVAPAGLEEMFETTGQPWSVEKGSPGSPQLEELAILKRIAPDYGIELG